MTPHHCSRVLQAMLRQEAQQPFTGLIFIPALSGACRRGPHRASLYELIST